MHSSSSEHDTLTGLPCAPTRQGSGRRTPPAWHQYRAIAGSRRQLELAIPGSRPRPKLYQSFNVNFLSLSTSRPSARTRPRVRSRFATSNTTRQLHPLRMFETAITNPPPGTGFLLPETSVHKANTRAAERHLLRTDAHTGYTTAPTMTSAN